MGYDHDMRYAHYIPLHRAIAKYSLSTSFSIISLSASETIGLPGWFRVEHREFIQDINSRNYSSFRWCERIKE